MINLAIFVSGSGSNAENIANYFSKSELFNVAIFISNRAEAFALERAKRLGIPAVVRTRTEINDAEAMLTLLRSYQIDGIILAGFLLKVPDYLIEAYPETIINIHPALLPKYGGKGMFGHHVHEAVIEAGDKESGITIHLVNSEYDKGRHLLQASCPVHPDDTPERLAVRVMQLEHNHYPITIEDYFVQRR